MMITKNRVSLVVKKRIPKSGKSVSPKKSASVAVLKKGVCVPFYSSLACGLLVTSGASWRVVMDLEFSLCSIRKWCALMETRKLIKS